MSTPKRDFRTEAITLNPQARVKEWKRLGFNFKPAEASNYYRMSGQLIDEYLKGSGITRDDMHRKKPKATWKAPTEPSPWHIAFLEHKDEDIAEIALSNNSLPAYLCYLIKEGWIEPHDWSEASKKLIEIGDKAWRMACAKVLASMQKEGVFLNRRGLDLLKIALDEYPALIGRPDRYSFHEFTVLKTPDDSAYPIGPGFEGFLDQFKAWVENKPLEELRILAKGAPAITPWILKYSKVVKDPKGVAILLSLALHAAEDDNEDFCISQLMENSGLNSKSFELLVEWALSESLSHKGIDQSGDAMVREIFLYFSRKNGQLTAMQQARTILGIGDRLEPRLEGKTTEEDEDEEQNSVGERTSQLKMLAMIPWVSQDPELREKMWAKANGYYEILVEMWPHAQGELWVRIANKLSKEKNIEEEDFVSALKQTTAKNLEGVRRTDLAPLLKSRNKEVRTEIIKLANMVPNRTEAVKAQTR